MVGSILKTAVSVAWMVFLLVFAALIDLLQAFFGLLFYMVGVLPGTFAGGAAGCYLGAKIAGSVGCFLGGTALGIVGSAGDVAAPFTLPIGVAMGIAVAMCLSFTLGTILILCLLGSGMFYTRSVVAGVMAEYIPATVYSPGWTVMTAFCIGQKLVSKITGAVMGTAGSVVGSPSGTALTPIKMFSGATRSAVQNMTERVQRPAYNMAQEQQDDSAEREEEKRRTVAELKSVDGIRSPKKTPAAANDNYQQPVSYAA